MKIYLNSRKAREGGFAWGVAIGIALGVMSLAIVALDYYQDHYSCSGAWDDCEERIAMSQRSQQEKDEGYAHCQNAYYCCEQDLCYDSAESSSCVPCGGSSA